LLTASVIPSYAADDHGLSNADGARSRRRFLPLTIRYAVLQMMNMPRHIPATWKNRVNIADISWSPKDMLVTRVGGPV